VTLRQRRTTNDSAKLRRDDQPGPIAVHARSVAPCTCRRQYVAGTAAPFHRRRRRPDPLLFTALDNLIAQKRVPAMIAISIGNGSGDAQGSQRGLEYDTMSGATRVRRDRGAAARREAVARQADEGSRARATMGCSSGASAALSMAWYHPELYHRVLSYSGRS
jgi:hypothetical protein